MRAQVDGSLDAEDEDGERGSIGRYETGVGPGNEQTVCAICQS
jgi:hypothetical protein